MKEILFKSTTTGAIIDVDTTKRIVVGYFAKFDDEFDSDRDIIDPRAFDNTLKMNGPNGANRIWHLWNHGLNSPINKPYFLDVDSKGERFETKFPDTTLGRDTIVLYQEKAITEHSFGYNVIDSQPISIKGVQGTLIKEIRQWEGSSVLWGANQNSQTIGLKAEDFTIKSSILDSLLHNGNLSDEMFEQLEKMLSDIKAMFRTSNPEPEQNNTTPCVPEVEIINSFYKSLNLRK